MFRKSGEAVGAIVTLIDDIPGGGEPDVLQKARVFSGRRFGKLKVQEGRFARVGIELAQETDSSVTLTQENFAKNLKLSPTSQ